MTSSEAQPPKGMGEVGDGYEPPRIEVLGTVEELTMVKAGGGTEAIFLASAFSDRRLKQAIEPLDTQTVLEETVAAVTSYDRPSIEVLGTIGELTMGGSNVLNPDNGVNFNSVVPSDHRLKLAIGPVNTQGVLGQIIQCDTP